MTQSVEHSVLRQTDEEARLLATRLLRQARYAALATLEPETGHPLSSRVTLANQTDGTPLILVSELSSHTPSLRADPRCSLLVGDVGKGDPLAHPRMTILCKAQILKKSEAVHTHARTRFLQRHPKAELYVDFGDFHFFQLQVERASLNGGFGKAYSLTKDDLILQNSDLCLAFEEISADVITHMNEDHSDNIQDYAAAAGFQRQELPFQMSGIDPAGMDLMSGDAVCRINFVRHLESVEEIRPMLIKMAKDARKALT